MRVKILFPYARADDEPFVKRLYEGLTTNGFKLRFDRVSMPSRLLAFSGEIAASDRLVHVVVPKAVESDYVDAE